MTENITARRRAVDGPHFVREDYLPGGAKLHRFDNAGGYPISAVYFRGMEIYWAYRDQEEAMLADWEKDWKSLVPFLEKKEDEKS